MLKRTLAAAFCLLCVSAQACFAAAITMILCQEESDSQVELPVRKISETMESVIMDTLFDNGHIVTNENICCGDSIDVSVRNGLYAAQDSYMDYYVVISVHFTGESVASPSKVSLKALENVEVTVRKIRSDAVVYQEVITPEVNARETESQGVTRFGSEIALKICKEITASK